jgi:methyl-accepting chemotaxis protein
VGSVAGGAERQVLMVASASDTAARMETAVGQTARTTEETADAARETREVARQGVTAAAQASAPAAVYLATKTSVLPALVRLKVP